MIGLLTERRHLNRHYDSHTVPDVTDLNRHLNLTQTFLVIVRP